MNWLYFAGYAAVWIVAGFVLGFIINRNKR
jgi:hypothetical protein